MEQLILGLDGIILSLMSVLDGFFNIITSVLNFQPFGSHGVNSILSVRVFHILGLLYVISMFRGLKGFRI